MEIEMKAILTPEQFSDLLAKYAEKITVTETKTDTYFSKYDTYEERKANKENVFRIRESSMETTPVFTYKKKLVENGVEKNVELETLISNIKDFISILSFEGYKSYFKKKKTSFGFLENIIEPNYVKDGDFVISHSFGIKAHVEIEVINDKIFAVEVEVIYNPPIAMTSNDSYPTDWQIADALKEWFTKNGLSDKIDDRSWITIIKEAEENANNNCSGTSQCS